MSGAMSGLLRAAASDSADEEREEAQWVARAQAGEEVAFCWLLARYRQRNLFFSSWFLPCAQWSPP